jgi:hypothetical protein
MGVSGSWIVLLRLPYLAVSSVFAFIRLLPMSAADKDIEILTLRHQLAVLQRQIDKPRITPTDRAFLAALLHRLPKPKLRQLHLIVSPETVLRRHRDLMRRRHADASRRRRSSKPPTRRSVQALVLRLALVVAWAARGDVTSSGRAGCGQQRRLWVGSMARTATRSLSCWSMRGRRLRLGRLQRPVSLAAAA